jgi:shikimate kinase
VTSYDRVLLIGMMGAGKTTIGHALSSVLGWRYYDNDELLLRAVGKDTRRVQQEDGVQALRRAESAALTVALTEGGPLIAGVAGGVVTDPLDLRRLHAGGFVVWLRADIETLAKRVAGTDRPWLTASPEKAMRALYAGREALYTAACSFVVDEDQTTPELIALEIARRLNAPPS